jgi:glycosyltransferase involved in cell wall biosynthesis
LPSLEVLVIQDGEDPETANALHAIADPRLHIHVAPRGGGPGALRNIGVARAQADWIAFLDDDDEMLPDRLARQLDAAEASKAAYPIVLCRSLVRTGMGDAILPEMLPKSGEHISEYIFVKKGILGQGGGVHVFCRKALLDAVPFPALPRHEDWAWLLRAAALPGSEWMVLAEPLVIYYIDEGRPSLSRVIDWKYSFDWALAHRELMSDRAYSAFLMSTVARLARQQAAYGAILKLLYEALRSGYPRPLDYAIFAAIWMMPGDTYRLAQSIRFMKQRHGKCGGSARR